MKILYCLAETCNSGGTEKIVIAKANELAARGHNVVIATTEQCGRPDFFALASGVRRIDFDINYYIPERGNFFARATQRRAKKAAHRKALEKLLRDENFDIAVSTCGNELRFLADIADGSKKIAEIHTSYSYKTKSRKKGIGKLYDHMANRLDAKAISRYDAFVCLTRRDMPNWRTARKIAVIPNFVDDVAEQPSSLQSKRVIAVGRLSVEKGFDRLLEAWKIVQERHSDWRLDIFGSGVMQTTLQKQIDDNRLTTVKINAPVRDIMAEYLNSSAVVMTSHNEGWGLVLLEGMACGLPAVAFDIECGPSDMIEDGRNGYLVADGDCAALAERICTIVENDNLRHELGSAAYETARQFTAERVIGMWEELFQCIQAES